MSSIESRLAEVKRSIEQAALSAGRDPSSVTLVAVTKGVSVERVREAIAAGHSDFGESRAQEAIAKAETLPEVRWHFLGRIQRNKIRTLGFAHLIHSIDRTDLIAELADRSATPVDCLLQVNLSGEPTKAGVPEEQSEAAAATFLKLASERLTLSGLMTIPPPVADPELSRPYFRQLRELRDRLASRFSRIHHLSMGMSQDYAVAVQEGATLVRVGTAIFGPRPARELTGRRAGSREE